MTRHASRNDPDDVSPFIVVEGLFYFYALDRPVLRDISFSLPAGATCCLAGANGSGKSTLLALLAGLYQPSSGVARIRDAQSAEGLRDRASLLLQDADLQILGATVREDLLLCLAPGQSPDPALAMARRFGLDHLLDAPVQALSYGQKRKLCLATALLGPAGRPPDLLLYDEPCSGLDYAAIREWRELLLANQAAGLTQIIAAHDLDPVIDLADTLLALDRGRLVLNGTPSTTLDAIAQFGVRPPCSWLAGRGVTAWE